MPPGIDLGQRELALLMVSVSQSQWDNLIFFKKNIWLCSLFGIPFSIKYVPKFLSSYLSSTSSVSPFLFSSSLSSPFFFSGKKLRVSEYKALMKNRREEMRQLWCQDGSPVGGSASLQQFEKFEPGGGGISSKFDSSGMSSKFESGSRISSSNSPGPVGAFGNQAPPSIATFQTSSSEQQPLVSPLHPGLPQFSLTPLNIAEVSCIWNYVLWCPMSYVLRCHDNNRMRPFTRTTVTCTRVMTSLGIPSLQSLMWRLRPRHTSMRRDPISIGGL